MTKRLLALLILAAVLIVVWSCKKDSKNPTAPAHSIAVTAPNGGETWQVGTSHNITWTSSSVTTVKISYSVNGGTDWTDIIASVAATPASYAWTVPNTVATTCKVKVADAADATVSDVSNANFAISNTDAASGTARSGDTTAVTVSTPGGARVVIPPRAVPTFEDGTAATQTFSIESMSDTPPTFPTGQHAAGTGYRFGPEGFVFGAPVTITLPLTGVPDSSAVYLYYMDESTDSLRRVSAVYDPVHHTVSAQTYHLSPWWPGWGPREDNTACGCVHVTNLTMNDWMSMCIDTYTLTYPDQEEWMVNYRYGGLWAPVGNIGVSNESKFQLPQGQYHMCVQWSATGSYDYHHYYTDITIGSPYDYWFHPNCSTDFTFTGGVGADTGRCVCVPTPSHPVHTGDVQVSLTWFTATTSGIDLDLHVMEPDSEEIAYYHTQSASGGQLDRDRICGDFTAGATENIYWTTNPPHGTYIVKVHFFGNCGTGATEQAFSLRTVVHGNTQTFSGTAHSGAGVVEVTRFNVSGPNVTYLPPQDPPQFMNLPAKNLR